MSLNRFDSAAELNPVERFGYKTEQAIAKWEESLAELAKSEPLALHVVRRALALQASQNFDPYDKVPGRTIRAVLKDTPHDQPYDPRSIKAFAEEAIRIEKREQTGLTNNGDGFESEDSLAAVLVKLDRGAIKLPDRYAHMWTELLQAQYEDGNAATGLPEAA